MLSSDRAFLEEVFPAFNQLNEAQRQKVLQTVIVRDFPKGAPLHQGSDDCAGLFLVVSGQLRAYILSDGGKEITLYRLLPRDICLLSASCLIKNIRFELFVSAEQDTHVLLIPTNVYQTLMEQSLAVAEATNELMASRFSDVMWVLEEVVFARFDRRLAAFLLEEASLEESDDLRITHEEIARHLGSAREVVTRMLKYFNTEGMVSLSRGGIHLTDQDKLRQMIQ